MTRSAVHRRALLVAALASIAAWAGPAAADPPRYWMVLIEPPERLEYAAPFRMNEKGEIAGYAAPEPYHPLAAGLHVDASGNASLLPTDEESFTFAFGISDEGRIAGQSGRRACIWEGGAPRFLLVPEAVFSGIAAGVNGSGLIVGNYGDSDEIGPRHCAWTDPALPPVTLPGLIEGNMVGTAWDVNEAGQIAGSSGGIEGGFIAALWPSATEAPIPIGPLPEAFNSEARALNARADVVGRSSFESGAIQSFIYMEEEKELVGLPFLEGGGSYSEAYDINDWRQVVGTARASVGVHAVLWQDGAAHDLNDLVANPDTRVRYLSSAGAINNSGQIAAEAVLGEGEVDLPRWIALLSPVFLRGDSNGDGAVDVSDPVFTLGFLFLGEAPPACMEAANSNDEGGLDISDPVHTLNYLFSGGQPIPSPHPEEGPDPTPGGLGCLSR